MIELIIATEIPEEYWPEAIKGKHRDWIPGLRWVPRSWTAYAGIPPVKVDGNAPEYEHYYRSNGYFWIPCLPWDKGAMLFKHPKPIPDKGEWWKGDPEFFAEQTANGVYRRSGYRWDDVDGYYEYPSFTIKVYDVMAGVGRGIKGLFR